MAIKVKAVERKLKFTKNENDPGVYRYVLGAELYTALNQKKVIREAALRSGVSQGVMQACWDGKEGQPIENTLSPLPHQLASEKEKSPSSCFLTS